jgi:VWFA-related protein
VTRLARRPIGLALVASSVAAVGLFAQQPTFRARLDAVRLDVLVLKGNKPLLGLTTDDFEVTDNGVPQHVDLLSAAEQPINAVVTLDLSGSVTGQRMNELRSASRALLDGLRAGDQAALVGFSHQLDLEAALTPELKKVSASLEDAKTGGKTSLYDASYAGLVLAESENGRSLALVFTDGTDTSSWLSSTDVLEIAKRAAVVVYGVAVKENVPGALFLQRALAERAYGAPVGSPDPAFLRQLSTLTGGSLVVVDSTRGLDQTFRNIILEFRQRYLLSYRPTNTPGDGWHAVRVNVAGAKGKGTVINARAGYVAGR